MMDLTTTYLGLTLKNPLVASASPLTKRMDLARRIEDAGMAAVVMYSLFEEQIIHESRELDYFIHRGKIAFAEVQSYFPEFDAYNTGPDGYLEEVQRLKQTVSIPVIASLNGVSTGGWIDYAQKIEQAGADALELNIYYLPNDPDLTSAELEDAYVNLARDVRSRVKIPSAVKLSPWFTSLPNVARRLAEAGANGLVLFNRFYQPDFDLEELEVVPNLVLSTSTDLRLPLRWIAMLYGRIKVDFAASSGVHTAEDVIKVMMAGASVSMMTSTLLKYGVDRAAQILADLGNWMEEHEYESIMQMKGSMSQQAVAEPAAFERVNYMKVLNSFEVNGERGIATSDKSLQRPGLSFSSADEDFMSL
jgi:dihydroorotate dehydrogenase (fumarate)